MKPPPTSSTWAVAWQIVSFQDDRCLRAKKDEVGNPRGSPFGTKLNQRGDIFLLPWQLQTKVDPKNFGDF